MEILAVIPARGGSKGIKKKNIKILCGYPLIYFTIKTALSSKLINNTVVSTDDIEIKKISENYGADVPFLRSEELSSDSALAVPTIKDALLKSELFYGKKFDYVLMLQPTTPLRSVEDIDNSINLMKDNNTDGVISIVNVNNWHPYKMKIFKENLLFDFIDTGLENPPRQSLPPVYMVNGAVYGCKRDVLVNKNSFKGDSCSGYVMPESRSVNIDSEVDFILAEYFLSKQNSNA
ncbi:MAG TPA: N-acylneuraminate cytidylyltransferase [Bacteroidetes bacterium]|nr:N-acylneuraminate cytidylyltransferase [Bacteroidota bacterium]